MIGDAIRAARLDPDLYNAIEHDRSYTVRAMLLVVVVSAASGLGSAIAVDGVDMIEGSLSYTVTGLVGWVMWSASASLIGRRLFAGTTDLGQMLRVLGYAQAPRIIGIVPFLGPVGWAWALVVVVTGGAAAVLLTWLATLVFGWLV
jgi:hypothetical protein